MRRNILTAITMVVAACPLLASPVKVHGYITGITSTNEFAVDGYRITRDESLVFEVDKADGADAAVRPEDIRIGTEVYVEGEFNDATHELHASCIKVSMSGNLRVKRTAVIEHATVLQRAGAGWRGVIHADGETLVVDSQTRVVLKEGQTNQLTAGLSIGFEGRRERDGSIACSKLELFASDSSRERKMFREVTPKLTSNGEIVIHGEKYKLVPDAEAQSYVQRIGAKLVPVVYRQDLSGGATRLYSFQFYLIENPDFNAHAFPNGTVLVNSGVLRVLTTEAQFAAVLGHEIAHATQEHAFRELQHQKNDVESVHEKGYASGVKGDPSANGYTRSLENQADRVGLDYMVTAGYDPRQAAEVWRQVANRAKDQKSGPLWSGQDDTTARRSYLLAQVRNNYSSADFQSYVRDSEEFDAMAQRFGNTAIPQNSHEPAGLKATRPDYQKPRQDVAASQPSRVSAATLVAPAAGEEKHYGANAVTITSDPAGAAVSFNGTVIGKTPLTLPTGSVGLPFTITVQMPGYRGWTGQLVSVPGRTNLRVELFSMQ
jgi:hypothetical protein